MDLWERGEPWPGPPSPGITLLDRAAKHHKKAVGESVMNFNPQRPVSQPELWNVAKTAALHSTAAELFLFLIWICISLSRLRGLLTVAYFCFPPIQCWAERKLLVWADQFPVEGVWTQLWLFYINNTVICKRPSTNKLRVKFCVGITWTEIDTSYFECFEECHSWLICVTLTQYCFCERPMMWCFNGMMKEQRQRSTWPREGRV